MLENTSRNLKVLAGAVGVNLALALAVSVGAVPQLGDHGAVRTASVAEAEDIVAPPVRQPGDAAKAVDDVTTTTAAASAAPPAPSTTVAKPKATTPPATKAPTSARTAQPTAAPTTAAPAAAAPTAPVSTKVPRRTPTAAEVQAAITELKRQVGGLLLLVSPTPAQIDQVGDQVCTAFDNGQTFAQVKATALSMIPPTVTVSAATTDWAVRQAVTLYCPGHASKLV